MITQDRKIFIEKVFRMANYEYYEECNSNDVFWKKITSSLLYCLLDEMEINEHQKEAYEKLDHKEVLLEFWESNQLKDIKDSKVKSFNDEEIEYYKSLEE